MINPQRLAQLASAHRMSTEHKQELEHPITLEEISELATAVRFKNLKLSLKLSQITRTVEEIHSLLRGDQ